MILDYIPLFLTVIAGFGLGVIFKLLAEYLGERRGTAVKSSTYESGMIPFGTARERYSVKFYMVAVSFIIFDIEVVFLYPWAVKFRELGTPGIAAMAVFFIILLLGYLYEIRKGGFEWE
ncbi:MAG: NADH-quinone oxidoreductase subunit A [Candidatus Kapabacteria bacterium]|nr:NADH-quinone oxidoreductase subunit A [Candidatus Kapabacteria bacterium]